MAWTCSGANNTQLVDNLKANGIVKVPAVERALREVDRGNFVPHSPYQDSPQPIGYNVTVSAPHMHSYCLDQLYNHCKLGGTVLDIGCGSGIFTALLSALASHGATVIGLDHIPELVELSRRNTEKAYKQVIDDGNIVFVTADGRTGYAERAPYDCIHIGAAVDVKDIGAIKLQLKVGGRLIAPVEFGHGDQRLVMYDRVDDKRFKEVTLMGVRYVPLTSAKQQLGHR